MIIQGNSAHSHSLKDETTLHLRKKQYPKQSDFCLRTATANYKKQYVFQDRQVSVHEQLEFYTGTRSATSCGIVVVWEVGSCVANQQLDIVGVTSSLLFTASFISSVCFILWPRPSRSRTVPISSTFSQGVEWNCLVSRFHLDTPLEIDFVSFCTTSFHNNT